MSSSSLSYLESLSDLIHTFGFRRPLRALSEVRTFAPCFAAYCVLYGFSSFLRFSHPALPGVYARVSGAPVRPEYTECGQHRGLRAGASGDTTHVPVSCSARLESMLTVKPTSFHLVSRNARKFNLFFAHFFLDHLYRGIFFPHDGGKQLFLFSPQGPENGGKIKFFPPRVRNMGGKTSKKNRRLRRAN